MIKVMIVDDEPKLRQGLQTLIPWESLGLTVTATAANGEEAIEVIDKEPPDILVVDIRMPLMDGLQLIQYLTSNGLQSQFIILSGYADFEYAKQAIKYGAAGYLLKPVDIKEMTSTLKRVCERIEEERLQRGKRQNNVVNREWCLHSLLIPQDTNEASTKLKTLAIEAELLWSSYEVVAVFPRNTDRGRIDALHQLASTLKTAIEGIGMGVVTVISPYIVLLLNKPLRGMQQRQKLYEKIQYALNVRFVAATGGAVSVPDEISNSYSKAQKCIKQAFFSEKGRLLGPDIPSSLLPDSSPVSGTSTEEMMEGFIYRIYYSLDAGHPSMILPLLKEAAAYFLNQEREENFVKESFFYLSNAVIHKLTAGSPKKFNRTEEVSRFLKEIFEFEYLTELLEETHRFLQSLAEYSVPEGKEKEVKIMINVIHKHYADNLKLETLAGMLNYSTAYLGQVFKNKTGEYFNTYLDKVRIQNAKKLLEQGMKVYEVAERVGYTNVNYFHSKFKKYVGRSPSDFKIHN
ncbi:DNA-binding response regulator [Paenibacillus sp. CAA11]|uniref:response regulator transcription factor n=1 Tax=Paenibacillus sp. CAA11 TaxID=1532905 RepID=UPI000D3CF8C3|nr:response regulator transcription factor [Paenibacillus sp. CAA11]AWB45540.1 DNA-binding response regulator [Paenibacillus sp. CAA11]